MPTITKDVVLVVEDCITCGIIHALPRSLRDHYQKNGGYWTCPNGHSQGWSKQECTSATDKLRMDLAAAQNNVKYYAARNDELWQEKDALNRQLSAKKGQITKIKNRVANGVCPCCNRSFTNLHRHMTTKHPDFTQEPV